MSIHFEQLLVREIRPETNDCVSIVVEVPEALQNSFQFKQGQYLTFRAFINGEEIRRSYSICSSPLDNELRVAVKKVEGGIFSTWANEVLKVGDTLDVMPPMGKFFTELHPTHRKQYLGFAAGSGITPLLSIIKTTLLTEPDSRFTLVYGNRNRQSIIFREELEALKNRFMNRFRLIHILSRERTDADIHSGRIDADKCAALTSKIIDLNTVDDVFLCGPEEMTFAVKTFLEKAGLPAKQIHLELFSSPGQNLQQKQIQETVVNNDPTSQITVKLDGISFDFNLGFHGMPILDAALKQGADLPYACKGGVCCTCRAKLIAGEVDMDLNYGLEPDEIEQGFILTCQSHPRSAKVVIDFDVK